MLQGAKIQREIIIRSENELLYVTAISVYVCELLGILQDPRSLYPLPVIHRAMGCGQIGQK